MKNRPTAHTLADSRCPLKQPTSLLKRQSHNIIDLLRTSPPAHPFAERVKELRLSSSLENKILEAETPRQPTAVRLTANDEKELAGEALMLRHTFTCLVFDNRFFRQAALTVIQNIYLFRQRRIFFGTTSDKLGEEERRQALLLFTGPTSAPSVPLAKTFQHFILARVWDRIITQANEAFLDSRPFNELHEAVERLNTLRNIYMLLSLGMVQKMTGRISAVYQHSISADDARQIGNFGIARAAYRYHPSLGIRFSTYAAHWVLKEIQRQALEGRLIRISSNLVEKVSRQARNPGPEQATDAYEELCRATVQTASTETERDNWQSAEAPCFEEQLEDSETRDLLASAIEKLLSTKSADVIKRRYGLFPYRGQEQSVVEIAAAYGVTRGSIYQLEQTALRRLKTFLSPSFLL